MDDLAPGTTFAGHLIKAVAGRGGMGVVYRAAWEDREVALKVLTRELSADREFRQRLQGEYRAAASIRHPNVVPVYGAGAHDGCLYVTMRYVDGEDLAHLLPLAPARAAKVVAQVADALDAAHALGIVHRDVKPANVLVEGDDHALLTDFGLMRDLRATQRLTIAGSFVGSFDYAAPEQLLDGDVDARTDVYALGCVLYQALSGTVPYPRDSAAATMFAHIEQPPPSLPGPFEDVIRRATAKAPAERFASAGELGRAALDAAG